MKALIGTAVASLIAMSGYLVYEGRSSKTAIVENEKALVESADYLACRTSLREIKTLLKSFDMWEGKTHDERIVAFSSSPLLKEYDSLLTLMYEVNWDKCGPMD